jgi:hypothetical protein
VEQEKELIELFRKMDKETRDLYLSHGRIALVAEEAGKRALLNRSPAYADRNPAPIGAALTAEALNG